MQIWMKLFQFAQMIPIGLKFERSCFNYPNMIEAVGICPNVSNCMQIQMKNLYIIQIGMKLFEISQNWIKLFEVTQNWMKMFHLAQIRMELLLFGQSWFSLLEFTQIFHIYGNISNFTPNLNEVVPICSNFIRIVKIYPNDSNFIQIGIKFL